MSSKHLLQIAAQHCKLLQADATYKLNWLGYPVSVVGITDDENVFHSVGLAFSREEKTHDYAFVFRALLIGVELINEKITDECDLLADAADAITNGFELAFKKKPGQYKRGNIN